MKKEIKMPLYEYKCQSCGHEFELLVKIDTNEKELSCPKCEKRDLRRKLSLFRSRAKTVGSASTSMPMT